MFLYVFAQTSFGKAVTGTGELLLLPLRHGVFSVYAAATQSELSPLEQLEEKIVELEAKLASTKEQEKEIAALRDQFSQPTPHPRSLLPVRIVGMKAFIPGFSLPEQIVIDKGGKDGVPKGAVVIYKNNLLGKISTTQDHIAVVDLTFKRDFSITATTLESGALGVVKGQGEGELLLDNVVLSDTLKKGDLVVTKGSTNLDGAGATPGLIIGKIVSVEKKASSLFQTAKVEGPLDITRLSTIFVQLKN